MKQTGQVREVMQKCNMTLLLSKTCGARNERNGNGESREHWTLTLVAYARVPVMDDACKPRYGSAISHIYTRSGASKRGRRVPSASSFRASSTSGLPIAKRTSPAGIVISEKKETGIPVQCAWFPWTNMPAGADQCILQLKRDETVAMYVCYQRIR